MAQFTCPKCGSHMWGTSSAAPCAVDDPDRFPGEIGPLGAMKPCAPQGMCHGFLAGQPCKFTWARSVARDLELGIEPPEPGVTAGCTTSPWVIPVY